MNISARDRRALAVVGFVLLGVSIFKLMTMSDGASLPQAVSLGSAQLKQRDALLRQTAAALPVREALLKQTDADLADRERGIIQADTFAEAQAELVLAARRIGNANQLDVRASDSPAPRVFGDYGMVYAAITFDCHIEQLLNFLADLTHEQELIVPSEERMAASNTKEKLMAVRIVLAGVVAKKLIPEKKGLGAF